MVKGVPRDFFFRFGLNNHEYISSIASADADPLIVKLKQETSSRRYNGIADEYWSVEMVWFLLKNALSFGRCSKEEGAEKVSNNYPGFRKKMLQ